MRLVAPLDDAQRALAWCPDVRNHRRAVNDAIGLILAACAEEQATFWGWSSSTWVRLINSGSHAFLASVPPGIHASVRPYVVAYAYLLARFKDFDQPGRVQRLAVARWVFGDGPVNDATRRICDVLNSWGYEVDVGTKRVIAQILLVNRSPLIEDITTEVIVELRDDPALAAASRRALHPVHRALAALGFAAPPDTVSASRPVIEGTSGSWLDSIEFWSATSTHSAKARSMHCVALAKAGGWLSDEHPDIAEPDQWTRETCAAWIAAVDRMRIGDWRQHRDGVEARIGQPLAPRTKAGHIAALRTFFRDLQEWDRIPRHFDPARSLATPRSIKALIGPDPRVIADEVWAKLLWAGLNLESDDLPVSTTRRAYPIELVRAVTITWMFAGLRRDEINRLRVGCVRWQRDDVPVARRADEILPADAVCLLDVPTHKTGTAFTKPVDVLLGHAIDAWQRVRPSQPPMLDDKTGERIDFLFAYRARRVSATYINDTIIPALCRKAGVPTADVRGTITSHRARSTIASQLYNAKEPMTLFELQAWLGHRSPQSTQHYAEITPITLAKAYTDAGYFARNVRTIEVLIDRDAIDTGATAKDSAWAHYDLGHRYCTYTFFEQCPHRMACARCDFYIPKDSTRAGLLEAKANLVRMAAAIPLTEDERAAVEDGQAAVDRLLRRLQDIPTPGAVSFPVALRPRTLTTLPVTEIVPPAGHASTP